MAWRLWRFKLIYSVATLFYTVRVECIDFFKPSGAFMTEKAENHVINESPRLNAALGGASSTSISTSGASSLHLKTSVYRRLEALQRRG